MSIELDKWSRSIWLALRTDDDDDDDDENDADSAVCNEIQNGDSSMLIRMLEKRPSPEQYLQFIR